MPRTVRCFFNPRPVQILFFQENALDSTGQKKILFNAVKSRSPLTRHQTTIIMSGEAKRGSALTPDNSHRTTIMSGAFFQYQTKTPDCPGHWQGCSCACDCRVFPHSCACYRSFFEMKFSYYI